MAKISVIGERSAVFGFSALGLDVRPAENEEETKEAFRALMKEDVGILYITEKAAEYVADEIAKLRFDPTPAVILIPGLSGNTGKGLEEVERSVEKAVGSKII